MLFIKSSSLMQILAYCKIIRMICDKVNAVVFLDNGVRFRIDHFVVPDNGSDRTLRGQIQVLHEVFFKAVVADRRNLNEYHIAAVKSLDKSAVAAFKLIFDQIRDYLCAAYGSFNPQFSEHIGILWIIDPRD